MIVFRASYGPGRPVVDAKARTGRTNTFDPVTALVTCPRCQKVMQIGMLVWDSAQPGYRRHRRPLDQRPTPRELAQLRAYASGFWLAGAPRVVSDPVNRNIQAECCCAPLPWRQECPVHVSESEEPT